MKHYVIFSYDINLVGGTQYLVEGKSRVLEKWGWKLTCFFAARSNRKAVIPYLRKFRNGANMMLKLLPQECPVFLQKCIVEWMKTVMGYCDGDEVIIESHIPSLAFWAELLAKDTHGKHCFFCVNEDYSSELYQKRIDFFEFKYRRGELYGSRDVLKRLFISREEILSGVDFHFDINENPVRDEGNIQVGKIKLSDWNICHIGRANKGYVTPFLTDFSKFVMRYRANKIQLIFVGNVNEIRDKIDLLQKENSNLTITELGDLVPIPRSLFQIGIDVFVASSGSARCVADEGELVIVGDAEKNKTAGLLGYQTDNSLYCGEEENYMTYDVALEKVLVEHVQDILSNKYQKSLTVIQCCEQNMNLIDKSCQVKEYYEKIWQVKNHAWCKIISKFFIVITSKLLMCLGYIRE